MAPAMAAAVATSASTSRPAAGRIWIVRSEEHTSELQSQSNLVCRLLLEKKKKNQSIHRIHNHANNRTPNHRVMLISLVSAARTPCVVGSFMLIGMHYDARARTFDIDLS